MRMQKPGKPSSPLGQAIARLRQSVNLSQTQLAERAEMTRGYVHLLEKGWAHGTGKAMVPKVDTLRRIANALASDGLTKEIDHKRADRYYRELAEVAGYLPVETPVAAPSMPMRRVPPKTQIYALLNEYPELRVTFDAIPDDVGPTDVAMIRQMITLLINQLRQQRGLEPVPLDM